MQGVSYDAVFASNANLQEQFKERLALYNNNTRMGICVAQKGNTNGIKACGMAIGNHDMNSNPNHYKYLEGKAWKNTGISQTANNAKTSVRLGNNSMPVGMTTIPKNYPQTTDRRVCQPRSHKKRSFGQTQAPLLKRHS
ncbi:vacuolating cytotoxin fragment 8 [Helicobacter acinonychis]|nr:vacuolating cyotoxin family protein [Helicobacter acinonychis]STP03869.1 vacuolating cytotoxin fragment 8 [Helicobacter acinonychis]